MAGVRIVRKHIDIATAPSWFPNEPWYGIPDLVVGQVSLLARNPKLWRMVLIILETIFRWIKAACTRKNTEPT
ncbi:MAG: hypothetical protein JRD47_06585 [Deltaproteobacteria bacterium]|nr:hypothetical protein [Deltaproteobacteria bacterium]